MPAYWIARTKVTDADAFRRYAERAREIIPRHGGRPLARAGRWTALEGAPGFENFFVIEFPSFEDAVACHGSPEYQEAAAFRRGAGEVEIVIVDGLPPAG